MLDKILTSIIYLLVLYLLVAGGYYTWSVVTESAGFSPREISR